MGDRVNAHCKSLQAVDWSAHREGVNDYMVLLVKETVTLHKVLSRYLQDTVLEASCIYSYLLVGDKLTVNVVYHVASVCIRQSSFD